MYSGGHTAPLSTVGFPIRTSPGQRSVGISPEHFAATHVLHRLLAPRHPPHALSSLLTSIFSELETIDRGPGPCSSQQTRVLRTYWNFLSTFTSCTPRGPWNELSRCVSYLKLMCFFNFPFVCTFQRTRLVTTQPNLLWS